MQAYNEFNLLFNSQIFNRVVIAVLLVWIASAALGVYLLTRFDTLILQQAAQLRFRIRPRLDRFTLFLHAANVYHSGVADGA